MTATAPKQQATQQTQQQTAKAPPAKDTEFQRLLKLRAKFTPVGETAPIELNGATVRSYISKPTKKGCYPTEQDIASFLKLCEARGLNPWVGDAFLVGYDSQSGPTFSLITSIQALLKRAELNPQFDGLIQGVVVRTTKGEVVDREGDMLMSGDQLLGAWSCCYRKDRRIPFRDRVNLEAFDKGFGLWNGASKAGMIVKCAQASVLRTAFPSQCGGLYIASEMAQAIVNAQPAGQAVSETPQDGGGLLERLIHSDSPPPATSAPPAATSEDVIPTPEHTPSPYEKYRADLLAAKSPAEARAIYDRTFGPDSALEWSSEENDRAVSDRDAVISELKG